MQEHSKPYTIRKIKKSLSIAWRKRGGLGFALKYRNEPVLFTSEGLGSDLTFFWSSPPALRLIIFVVLGRAGEDLQLPVPFE